jgi:hypothetical protein
VRAADGAVGRAVNSPDLRGRPLAAIREGREREAALRHVAKNVKPQEIDGWLVELEAALGLPMGTQVLEDALCNWRKSPARYEPFRGERRGSRHRTAADDLPRL